MEKDEKNIYMGKNCSFPLSYHQTDEVTDRIRHGTQEIEDKDWETLPLILVTVKL